MAPVTGAGYRIDHTARYACLAPLNKEADVEALSPSMHVPVMDIWIVRMGVFERLVNMRV